MPVVDVERNDANSSILHEMTSKKTVVCLSVSNHVVNVNHPTVIHFTSHKLKQWESIATLSEHCKKLTPKYKSMTPLLLGVPQGVAFVVTCKKSKIAQIIMTTLQFSTMCTNN